MVQAEWVRQRVEECINTELRGLHLKSILQDLISHWGSSHWSLDSSGPSTGRRLNLGIWTRSGLLLVVFAIAD